MRLIFEGLTKNQAIALAHWYERQGEQDASMWLEERSQRAPVVDVHDKNWLTVTDNNVTVKLKS